MPEFRSPIVILKEAELMASAPEVVAEWLKGHSKGWYDPECDDALELAILGRNEPLIDLALARYGVSREVLNSLFLRGELPIRVASLSNENVIAKSFLFSWQFIQDGEDFDWMGELSRPEIFALFSNPGLPNHIISDFFGGSGAWLVLDDDQRLDAAEAMSGNLVARSNKDKFVDGWDHYSYGKVFDSAWRFADKVEVNLQWAYRLGRLYRNLTANTFTKFEPLEAAKRWHVPANINDLQTREAEDNDRGYLGGFQVVRLGLARLAAGHQWQHSKTREVLMKSNDVAVRCGGYLVFDFSAEEIRGAWEKDRKLAARFLIENSKTWSKGEKREALEEICQIGSKDDDYLISLMHDFRRQEEQHRVSNPEWFEEDAGLAFGEETVDPMMGRLDRLEQRLAALQTEAKWGFILLFALSVWHWFS